MRKSKQKELPLVMIADHDEDERGLLKAVLKLKGFKVIEADDGRKAIALTSENHPDLLVVNLNLPNVSGLSAIRRIRRLSDFRRLPIVTVSSARRFQRGKLNDRAMAHLSQPIQFEELDGVLDRFLPGQRVSWARA